MTGLTKTLASLALLLVASACTSYYEIPIETPLKPKLDVSRFQRVLIAGFVAGGSDDIDANLETARLLRSQLRSESRLQVVDAEVLDLLTVARSESDLDYADDEDANGNGEGGGEEDAGGLSEEELEEYEHIFANVSYWRQLGEEHQNPLIVTGTIHFTPHARAGMVTRERELYDEFGRRRVVPVRAVPRPARLRAEPEVHLHRRADRGHALHGAAPRGGALRRVVEHAGALLVLRADGPPHPVVPRRPQRPEHQGLAHPPEVAAAGRARFTAGRPSG